MLVREFSTETVAARERFALWEEFSKKSHMPNRLRSEHQDDFRAAMRVVGLGGVQVSTLSFPHMEVVRTPRLARRCDPEMYLVNCVLGGEVALSLDDRETTCRPGDIVLLDSGHPFRGQFHAAPGRGFHLVTLVPRTLLPLSRSTVQRALAVPISARHGMGAAFHRWLSDLSARAEEFTAAEAPTLASVTVDLLASLLGHCLDAEKKLTPESRRQALRVRICGFVEQHLGDPDLTPGAIAAAHGISVSHLHAVFADQDLTVAAWIRNRRLERCRRDLADPLLLARPVQAVAARWGFTSPAHFSRAFRAAYDMSPREYRHAAVTGYAAYASSTSLD
ncbi:AraC-like ligand-binding domain-containing protein [Streptomyces sp. NPDC001212]|uniref:AraC-like ligand-binding domain-containing protein n=1 Tax=Streptomyces sp. CoT10 TaxID=2875762 RepID=UPI001CD7B0CD|nr:helix-turn-helix domain-containing protein [Streptomyces sp. CoT10]